MSKLYYRYGAMNAGKSTALLQVAHNYQEKGMNVVLIKSKIDTKGANKIISRIGIEAKVDILLDINDTLFREENLELIKKAKCILVDESQFLKEQQIEELWYITKQLDIPVICFGIRTDFLGKLFEGSKRLMELADEMEELPTICACGDKARFNARIVGNNYVTSGSTIEIDNNSNIQYESLCGKCYIKKVLKK